MANVKAECGEERQGEGNDGCDLKMGNVMRDVRCGVQDGRCERSVERTVCELSDTVHARRGEWSKQVERRAHERVKNRYCARLVVRHPPPKLAKEEDEEDVEKGGLDQGVGGVIQ